VKNRRNCKSVSRHNPASTTTNSQLLKKPTFGASCECKITIGQKKEIARGALQKKPVTRKRGEPHLGKKDYPEGTKGIQGIGGGSGFGN